MGKAGGDPSPLTLRQLRAFLAVAARELLWVLPNVQLEYRAWEARAQAIPEKALREDAIATLRRDRLTSEGAALFSVLPRRRHRMLVRMLVAYQIVVDYLDTISERPCSDPEANGRQLHRALEEALDPGGEVSDHYRHHTAHADGGFLDALVRTCRRGAAALKPGPALALARRDAARQAQVQVINHAAAEGRRDAELEAWARQDPYADSGASWFELAAAASSSLSIHVALALAADPDATAADVIDAHAAYMPWVCAAGTMLDSYADQLEDAAAGDHSCVGHYEDAAAAARRIETLVLRALVEVSFLRDDARHALIVCGMVALYLSKDSAWDPQLHDLSLSILAASGSLPRLQLPILWLMRRQRRLQRA